MKKTLTAPELIAANDHDFRDYVDRDLRGAAPEAHDALRSPAVVARWFAVLQAMFRSVENQLASRKASHRSELFKLQSEALLRDGEATNEGYREILALESAYERSRSGSLRFKSGVEEALVQARFLRDQFTPDMPVYKIERDELLRQVSRLETAIERHREQVLSDNELGSVTDEELWKLLPAEEIL